MRTKKEESVVADSLRQDLEPYLAAGRAVAASDTEDLGAFPMA